MLERLFTTRIATFLTVALSLLGIGAYLQIPREEDPRIKKRNATSTIVWPGATTEQLGRLVVRPLDDELLRVSALKKFSSEIRPSVVVYRLELNDSLNAIPQIEAAWREVERAIETAAAKLPSGVRAPILDFKVLEVESIVLALSTDELSTGQNEADYIRLIQASKTLRDQLRSIPGVAEVRIFGDPGHEMQIEVDPAAMHSLGIQIPDLLRGIAANNTATSRGFTADQREIRPIVVDNDLPSAEEFGRLTFDTGALRPVQLSSFAETRFALAEPPQTYFRWNSKPAIGLGIVPQEGLNVVTFGDRVRERIAAIQTTIRPMSLEYVAYQPERTKIRLSELLESLGWGMLLIALMLLAFEGPRAALVVSLCVPVITLISLFVYFLTAGVLHQISIAAFIISIGQFIDNIIVINDQIQRRINMGESKVSASIAVQASLRVPLAFATLTAICAFLPILAAQGSPADFVQALPLIAIIALIVSYFVSVFFVPVLCRIVLSTQKETLRKRIVDQIFNWIERLFSKLASGPQWRIATLAGATISISVWAFVHVEKEFFPESDRNEFILTFELPPSADIRATHRLLKKIETDIARESAVKDVAAFAGGGIPRFYYNIPNVQKAPQVGQLLIATHHAKDIRPLGLMLEKELLEKYRGEFPDIAVTSQFLQQGPPINAKIELKIFAPTENERNNAAKAIHETLITDTRLRSIRRDPALDLTTTSASANSARLAELGLTRQDLDTFLSFYTGGVVTSLFRYDRDLIPVRIGVRDSDRSSDIGGLATAEVIRGRDRVFKAGDLANFSTVNTASILRTERGAYYTRVLADLMPGQTFPAVMNDLESQLDKLREAGTIQSSTRIAFGGDSEGAEEANASIFKIVPLSMTLLLVFLLIEFNSFRKVMIVLLALPITVLGAFPGLLLGGVHFGFMSLLGILALMGIAVNNMILLLEALSSDETDMTQAIRLRLRAIFMTTILTLAGLIPLALEESPLWPPLAWTMISGLITGTISTLIIVPGLYRLFFGSRQNYAVAGLLILVIAGALPSNPALAESDRTKGPIQYSVSDIITLAARSSSYKAAQARIDVAQSALNSSNIRAYLPSVTVGGEWYTRQRDLEAKSPFGTTVVEDKTRAAAQVEIRQSLFQPALMQHATAASTLARDAEAFAAEETLRQLKVRYGQMAIGLLKLGEEQEFHQRTIVLMRNRAQFLSLLIARGRGSRSDLVKIELATERAKNGLRIVENQMTRIKSALAVELQLEGDLIIKEPLRDNDPTEMLHALESAVSPEVSTSIRSASEQELSLRALELDERRSQIRSATLPSLDVFGRLIHASGRQLDRETWPEVGVGLRWEIPVNGLRRSEAEEVLAKRKAVNHAREALVKLLASERASLASILKNTQQRVTALADLRSKTDQARKWEEEEYKAGRTTLQSLIEADTAHLETGLQSEIAILEMLEACLSAREKLAMLVDADCNVDRENVGDKK
jgi:multidrug efflux pump subunit AcrB/outer membrane protein TolC